MDSWKDAWVIFYKDLRSDRLFLIWNVIFMLYISLFLGFMVRSSAETGFVLNPMADFLMLSMIPFTGFFFSRRSFSYLKEDSYTQMLRYYRTLPIPLKTIMRSRLIQLGAMMLFNGIIFYVVFYAIGLRRELDLGGFIAFALTWTGYGLFINGAFIYYELLKKGKVYLWMSLVLMAVFGFTAYAIDWFGGNLMSFTMDYSGRYVLLSPLMWGALVGGVLGLSLFGAMTRRKLAMRDLA
ncbi:hypothetical protein [Paenibacillus macerans]|uniref:hypothetical protein n=1 Tax=Paenibacillus macerans TaxID=44252 RepID=UPI003D31C14D